MAKKWVVAAKKADFNSIAERFHISPYLARMIRNKDIIGDDNIERFLHADRSMMHDPSLLKDIDLARDIIMDAIEAGVRMRIVGDYDIDGVCASYILEAGLEYMGANVDVRIPDRVLDGYGINANIIREASEDEIELIITCDNGIAAIDEINLANELGMSVIVTDHHEIHYIEEDGVRRSLLPKADAVIDPKREDCPYPFKGICGAMVAYKFIEYMIKDYSTGDEDSLCDELFSFAAFATVGDVMELVDENRIAVKYGIELLKNTSNIGMRALIDVTGVRPENLSVYHIGFILGPCINASGRLDTARRALELFKCLDIGEASIIAQELSNLNESRKNMTISFAKEAISRVEEQYSSDRVLVVFLESCHESIAGIVAGRIRERFYRPTIVLTLDSEGEVKGSGRSIDGYDMFEELTRVKDIFTRFGGHKMAAGLSMKRSDIEVLRRRLNENCSLTEDDLIEKMIIDIPLPIGYVNLRLIDEIELLAPFGVGNSKPLFAQKDIAINSVSLLGKNKNVCKLSLEGVNSKGEYSSVDAVLFENAEEAFKEISAAKNNKKKISILYQAGVNEYQGSKSVQLLIKDYYI